MLTGGSRRGQAFSNGCKSSELRKHQHHGEKHENNKLNANVPGLRDPDRQRNNFVTNTLQEIVFVYHTKSAKMLKTKTLIIEVKV